MISANSNEQEAMPTYEAINLETQRRKEGIEIDMRIKPDIEDLQTNIRSEPTTAETGIKFETTLEVQTSQTKVQKARRKSDVIFDKEKILQFKSRNKRRKKSDKSGPSVSLETEQEDSQETTDFKDDNLSCTSSGRISPETASTSSGVKQRGAKYNTNSEPAISTQIGNENENDEKKTKYVFERRRVFNLAKHIVSIVLIIIDSVFDWVEYCEMNKRGNYSTVAERRVNNVEFTTECVETGQTIQFVFLIFTIVATLISVIQIIYITYQIISEVKRVIVDKIIINEYVETFVFLFCFELSQILLLMAFYNVCTLDCKIDATEIFIVLSGLFSISKISWRFLTAFKCCTVYSQRPANRNPTHPTDQNRHKQAVTTSNCAFVSCFFHSSFHFCPAY